MFSNLLKGIFFSFSYLVMLSASPLSLANEIVETKASLEAQLLSKPTRCIALHKGQVCYQKVTMNWQYSGQGSVCLYDSAEAEPISCWTKEQEGRVRVNFQSSTDKTYQLKVNNQVIAESSISVSWVYSRGGKKVSKKRSWRMF